MKEKEYKYKIDMRFFILYQGKILYRIKACRNIRTKKGIIKKNQMGGYIEGYKNLSQQGSCWVEEGAKVLGSGRVTGHVLVEAGKVVKHLTKRTKKQLC